MWIFLNIKPPESLQAISRFARPPQPKEILKQSTKPLGHKLLIEIRRAGTNHFACCVECLYLQRIDLISLNEVKQWVTRKRPAAHDPLSTRIDVHCQQQDANNYDRCVPPSVARSPVRSLSRSLREATGSRVRNSAV